MFPWLALMVYLAESRLTWEWGIWACLEAIILKWSIGVERFSLPVARTIPWAGDGGLYKMKSLTELAGIHHLLFLLVDAMWPAAWGSYFLEFPTMMNYTLNCGPKQTFLSLIDFVGVFSIPAVGRKKLTEAKTLTTPKCLDSNPDSAQF